MKEAVFRRMRDETEVDEVVSALRGRLKAAVASLPSDRALGRGAGDGLVDIACERVRLLLASDFTRYRNHVASLLGQAGTAPRERETPMDEAKWNLSASFYRFTPIDPERAEVRALYLRGKRLDHTWAGGTSERLDSQHFYSNVRESPDGWSLSVEADVYSVLVPVETTDGATDSRVRVFLLLSFVRTGSGNPWMPWRAGLNDPLNQAALRPPWL